MAWDQKNTKSPENTWIGIRITNIIIKTSKK